MDKKNTVSLEKARSISLHILWITILGVLHHYQ